MDAPAPRQAERLALGFAVALFAALALKAAWVADDAMITMRTVDNLVNGLGPVWNVGERVQVYTHPLWMLLLALVYPLGRDPWLTPIIVGMACSLAAVAIVAFVIARSLPGALLAVTTLALSKGFIDYSTSGLENPLSHLLLAGLIALYLRRPTTPWALFRLALLACLLVLNRQDLLLLAAPMVAFAALAPGPRRGARVGLAALAFTPLALWMAFSLFYYGFPFPNTAYAKLNTGLTTAELIPQGFIYLVSSLDLDPLMLLAIGFGALLPLVRRDWWAAAISLGIGLYLLYVVRIGGDFMSGRFLTAPLLASAALIAACLPAAPASYGLVAAAAIIGLLNPRSPILNDSLAYPGAVYIKQGVADERPYYATVSALVNVGREGPYSNDTYLRWARAARAQPAFIVPAIGYYGIAIGPGAYIVDPLALSDPLLARLPAEFDPAWRIGHFRRALPEGYLATASGPTNQIADPDLAAYYDALRLITRGPLFDSARLATIWRMNTGGYNHLIQPDRYRFPRLTRLSEAEAASPAGDSAPRPLDSGGIAVKLDAPRGPGQIAFTASGGGDVLLLFYGQGREQARLRVRGTENLLHPLEQYLIEVPAAAARQGYDEIRVLPAGPWVLSFGHLQALAPDQRPTAARAYLSPEWYLPEDAAGTRWSSSPATIVVEAAEAQPLWLELIPGPLFEPTLPDGRGQTGRLEIEAPGMAATTVDIERDRPFEIAMAVPAGGGTIRLNLANGNFRPLDRGIGLDPLPRSFAITGGRLYTVAERPPPADLLIDGQPQVAAPGRHLIYLGDGWHERAAADEPRWAAEAAELRIFSPAAGPAVLRLSMDQIFDGEGPGTAGTLRVSLNEGAATEIAAASGEAAVSELALEAGWNTVRLELAEGSFRPKELDPSSADERVLSFSVSAIELATGRD